MIPILDTHQHLIYPSELNYPWCQDEPALKDRSFTLEKYQSLTAEFGVTRSLFMEATGAAEQIAEEAGFFTQLAEKDDNILTGVIASCRPEYDDFDAQLERIVSQKVVGMRRILHVEPDELSQSANFRKNIASLADHQLSFDICMLQRQHDLAYELVKSCPDTTFILDHCGNPVLQNDAFASWKSGMQKLATLPNLNLKISGIVVNTVGDQVPDLELLRPWLESCVDVFGFDRLVFGSDWPVCNITTTLPAWLGIARSFFGQFSEHEQTALWHKNAERIYLQR